MIYIESYNLQKKDADLYYQSDIFLSYCQLNCFLNDFKRSHEEIREGIVHVIDSLTEADHEAILKSISLIKGVIDDYEKSHHVLMSYGFDGVIFLYGDQTVDAQGILIEGRSYMIVDVIAYAKAIDKYNAKSFVVHEMIHPIHYKLNPTMYFTSFESRQETTLSRMWLEGLATYLTKHFTSESDTDIFWLGYLDESGVKQWLDHANKRRYQLGQCMLNSSEEWSFDRQAESFSVVDPDNLWTGRLAYYYGYEIVKLAHQDNAIDDLFAMTYKEVKAYIRLYFSKEDLS